MMTRDELIDYLVRTLEMCANLNSCESTVARAKDEVRYARIEGFEEDLPQPCEECPGQYDNGVDEGYERGWKEGFEAGQDSVQD